MHDDYKPLDTPEGVTLDPCPLCASDASLWQYSESETAPRKLLVCCTHGDRIGPQDGLTNEGCPFYMPPDHHYRETIRDAVRYWNELARAIVALREANTAGVMASEPKQEPVALVIVREGAEDEFFWAGKGVLLKLPPGEYDLYLAPNAGVKGLGE